VIGLAFKNLARRPLRNGLTIGGVALALGVLVCLSSFGNGYKKALNAEVDRMGMQMMLVPLGCPYDAAARVLKGQTLEFSLPESALEAARKDPAVAVAAPVILATVASPGAGRADMWAGIDESVRPLKPWWQARSGQPWFTGTNSIILGADAAEIEMRAAGDRLYSPELGASFQVAGILERSGTSDDSLFFVPLKTAQQTFHMARRVTAIAIRLHDPSQIREASARLQLIPGAQVVTLTEMMGTFLNLVGAVRTLLFSIALVAIAISVLGVFNTLLAAVVERGRELSVMRALGASQVQVLFLVTTEALLLTTAGSIGGIVLALVGGKAIESVVKNLVPLAPVESLMAPGAGILWQTMLLGITIGVLGGMYPAWRASRNQPAEALKSD
jgi:putative ABC transport system permease protein